MLRQLSQLFALMMSSGLISVGHGAIGALMIQQGAEYGFSDTFLGLLVTISYIGFVVGNYLFRWLLPRISYIRTFAVCASAIAAGTLLLPILPEEIVWGILRFSHGLFFSTTVVICESWLNSTVDNQHRGKLHGTYVTINYIAYGFSQYILLLGSEHHYVAFSLVAIFIVLSLAPICMTRFPEPQFSRPDNQQSHLTITDAYRIAPLAYVAQLANGAAMGATWLFVRYASSVTDTTVEASHLAVLFFGSGFLLQLPIGWVADKVQDRRSVMAVIYALSSGLAVLMFFGELLPTDILTLAALLFGAISATAFSLCVAYGQDFAGRERAAEYAGRLFQPYAVGATIGPFVVGFLMDSFSPVWLFAFICMVFTAITILTITDRVMPRFIPVKQSSYQAPTAGYNMSVINQEEPLYNEYDVGPTPPPSAQTESDADEPVDFVGPQQLDDDMDEKTDDLVGPLLLEDEDEDDSRTSWRR